MIAQSGFLEMDKITKETIQELREQVFTEQYDGLTDSILKRIKSAIQQNKNKIDVFYGEYEFQPFTESVYLAVMKDLSKNLTVKQHTVFGAFINQWTVYF